MYNIGDYVTTNFFPEDGDTTVKILSIVEETGAFEVLYPSFSIYSYGDVNFRLCEIETNDITGFSSKENFIKEAKNSLAEYQNMVNENLVKMNNLIILNEVID